MKEANNEGWDSFREKLQHYDMPEEKGDWAGLEHMLDNPPPTPPINDGGSSIFGGMAFKLFGLALLISTVAVVGYFGFFNQSPEISNPNKATINEGLGNNDNQEIKSLETIEEENSETKNQTNLATEINEEIKNNKIITGSTVNNETSIESNTLLVDPDNKIEANANSNNITNSNAIASNREESQIDNISGSNSTSNSNQKEITGSSISESSNFSININTQRIIAKDQSIVTSETFELSISTQGLNNNNNTSSNRIENNALENVSISKELISPTSKEDTEEIISPSFDWNSQIEPIESGSLEIPYLKSTETSLDSFMKSLLPPIKPKKDKRTVDITLSAGGLLTLASFNKEAAINPVWGAHVEFPVSKKGSIELGAQIHNFGNFKVEDEVFSYSQNGIDFIETSEITNKQYRFLRVQLRYKHMLNPRLKLTTGVTISGDHSVREKGRIVTSSSNFNQVVSTSSISGYDLSFSQFGFNFGAEYRLNNKFSLYAETETRLVNDILSLQELNADEAPGFSFQAGLKWHPIQNKIHKDQYFALKIVGGSTIAAGSAAHGAGASVLFGGNIAYRFKKIELETGMEYSRINGYNNGGSFERTFNVAGGDLARSIFRPVGNAWREQIKIPLRVKYHMNDKWVASAGIAWTPGHIYNVRYDIETINPNDPLSDFSESIRDLNTPELQNYSLLLGGEYKFNKGLSFFSELEITFIDEHKTSEDLPTGLLANVGLKYNLFRL